MKTWMWVVIGLVVLIIIVRLIIAVTLIRNASQLSQNLNSTSPIVGSCAHGSKRIVKVNGIDTHQVCIAGNWQEKVTVKTPINCITAPC